MFGQEICIEVKVPTNSENKPSMSQEELFRAALHMTESMNLGTFDECVEALKKCNGDQNSACQLIFDKN